MPKDKSKAILREIRFLRSELSDRLDLLEARLGDGPGSAPGKSSASANPSLPPGETQIPVVGVDRPSGGFQMPTERDVTVVIQPLRDLSMARIVEQSLGEAEGVESSTLRELRGNSATIETRVDEGVSLITALRRRLPVAFDVTDSDSGSVTIALTQPLGKDSDGVAGQDPS